jgi:rapamycin-insensitive companion of mTOR
VIVTSDTFISVRATVLLGQLLHLIHLFLPSQICSITPALPSLMSQASAGKPQALAAIAALRRLHSMLEARPASSSLFLDHIIQYCSGAFREKVEDTTKSRKEKDNANMAKPKTEGTLHKDNSIEFLDESDNENEPKQRHSVGSRADVPNRNTNALVKSKSVSSRTSAAVSKVTKSAKLNRIKLFERDSDSLIRCTLVMQNKDGNTWNWEIIRTILKVCSETVKRIFQLMIFFNTIFHNSRKTTLHY